MKYDSASMNGAPSGRTLLRVKQFGQVCQGAKTMDKMGLSSFFRIYQLFLNVHHL